MKKDFIKSQEMIKKVKSLFEEKLSEKLNLIEVQAPMLLKSNSGIQDNLSGHENSVKVNVKALGDQFEVVHSLAKWKRKTLSLYDFEIGTGLYTNMKALRPDEDNLSQIHSVCVDQWDWEKVICIKKDYNLDYLKREVSLIYSVLYEVQQKMYDLYKVEKFLPKEIKFIHTEDLLKEFPMMTSKEREYKAAKKYKAFFLIGIGKALSDGKRHDVRAPDYDDWSTINDDGYFGLNGDIIVWNPETENAFELSSMGIRVTKESLKSQMFISGAEMLDWHKSLMSDKFKQTIGGGIGQSRLAMLLLRKKHIGKVQCGVWSEKTIADYDTL